MILIGLTIKPLRLLGIQKYWNEFWEYMEKYLMKARREYTDNEFTEALEFYLNRPIEERLESSLVNKALLNIL